MFKGIKEITFFVNNIDKATEYYKNIFGEPCFKSKFFVLFDINFINIGLHLMDEKSLSDKSNIVPYFSVDDIDKAIDYLLNNDFKIYREKIKGIDGPIVCQPISLFNNVIGLIQE
jgi:predicted enzyme related to lactoylglutathione lyase